MSIYSSRTVTPPASPTRAEEKPKRTRRIRKVNLSGIHILVSTTVSVHYLPPLRTSTSSLSSVSLKDSPISERTNLLDPTYSDIDEEEASFPRLPPTPSEILSDKDRDNRYAAGFPRTEMSYFPSSGGLWRKEENETESRERIEFETMVGRFGFIGREVLVKVWENEGVGEVEKRVKLLEEKIAKDKEAGRMVSESM